MVKCPNCGAEVSSTDKRCSKCGSKIKNNSNNLIIGIVIAVILIAVVGIFASGVLSDNSSNNVVVNNTDSGNTSVNTDSTNVSSNTSSNTDSQDGGNSEKTVYWASAKANKFHKPSCEWAQKIKESNKIVYTSRDEAIADGRVPCGACNP